MITPLRIVAIAENRKSLEAAGLALAVTAAAILAVLISVSFAQAPLASPAAQP